MKRWSMDKGICLAAAASAGCFQGTAVAEDQPNILLIIADDIGIELGCYGDANAVTPRLDRMAAEGVRFNRAHVTAASSSPSRGSMMTGLFPHQNGMVSLSQQNWSRMHDDVPKLPNELKKLGYHTSLIGKAHFEPFDQFEWDAFVFDPRKVNLERDVLWMNARGMEVLDQREPGQPFFMVMSYIDPHRGGGQGRTDPDEGTGRYGPGKNLIFPRIRSGLPEDPLEPEQTHPIPYLGMDTPEVRLENSDYYAAIQRLDWGVGELLDDLERRGELERTLVVFIGDHGADVTRGKISAYATATHIPMLVRWPGRAKAGLVRDELVSTVDLFPTFIEAAGGRITDPRQTGRALQPLVREGTVDWRKGMATQFIAHVPWHYYPRYTWFEGDYHFIHNVAAPERPSPLSGINHCFAWWEVQKPEYEGTPIREVYDRVDHPPEFELFHLGRDPYCFVNLADQPEMADVLKRMQQRVAEWRRATDDPFLDPEYAAAYEERVNRMYQEWRERHGIR